VVEDQTAKKTRETSATVMLVPFVVSVRVIPV
jgi:hypothetical protein